MWGDQPPGREGGVKPVGQHDQVLQKRVFYGTPKLQFNLTKMYLFCSVLVLVQHKVLLRVHLLHGVLIKVTAMEGVNCCLDNAK